jgi:hypothetical protein
MLRFRGIGTENSIPDTTAYDIMAPNITSASCNEQNQRILRDPCMVISLIEVKYLR